MESRKVQTEHVEVRLTAFLLSTSTRLFPLVLSLLLCKTFAFLYRTSYLKSRFKCSGSGIPSCGSSNKQH